MVTTNDFTGWQMLIPAGPCGRCRKNSSPLDMFGAWVLVGVGCNYSGWLEPSCLSLVRESQADPPLKSPQPPAGGNTSPSKARLLQRSHWNVGFTCKCWLLKECSIFYGSQQENSCLGLRLTRLFTQQSALQRCLISLMTCWMADLCVCVCV